MPGGISNLPIEEQESFWARKLIEAWRRGEDYLVGVHSEKLREMGHGVIYEGDVCKVVDGNGLTWLTIQR